MRKKVTLILGPSPSGKTTKAKQLTEGKKAVWIYGLTDSDFAYSEVTRETEIIVIEGADISNKNSFSQFLFLVTTVNLIVHKRGVHSFEMTCPDLIITSNTINPEEITPRPNMDIINLYPSDYIFPEKK